MEISYGAFGEGKSRLQGAVIAGTIAGTCMAAVPSGLLELIFSSLGLSELVPALAPPIGWPVRTALVLLSVAVAAALGGSGGEKGSGQREQRGQKEEKIMGWTQSLGLHHLVRLARSGAGASGESAKSAPVARRSAEDKARDLLARRRADIHPDAPPRVPLMASRDLPPVMELVEAAMPGVQPEPLPRAVTPIRDTTDKARPRPLPRAPEALSDSDVNWVREALQTRPPAPVIETVVAPVEELVAAKPVPIALVDDAPADDDALMALLGRFEQGVAGRIALRDAADAKLRLVDSLPETEVEPVAPVVAPTPEPSNDTGMDEALSAALETLRKLSAKANGR